MRFFLEKQKTFAVWHSLLFVKTSLSTIHWMNNTHPHFSAPINRFS